MHTYGFSELNDPRFFKELASLHSEKYRRSAQLFSDCGLRTGIYYNVSVAIPNYGVTLRMYILVVNRYLVGKLDLLLCYLYNCPVGMRRIVCWSRLRTMFQTLQDQCILRK